MNLMPFFQWLQDSGLSKVLNDSSWLYAVIQAFHLVTLAIFAGALLILDLRLLGHGFKQQSVKEVAKDAQPWLLLGFVGLIATGTSQLVAGALKEYYSPIFWIKMWVLGVAIVYTFTVRHMVARADPTRVGGWAKLVAIVSILLWVGVAVPARLIGLF
jgi:hypothetical protein